MLPALGVSKRDCRGEALAPADREERVEGEAGGVALAPSPEEGVVVCEAAGVPRGVAVLRGEPEPAGVGVPGAGVAVAAAAVPLCMGDAVGAPEVLAELVEAREGVEAGESESAPLAEALTEAQEVAVAAPGSWLAEAKTLGVAGRGVRVSTEVRLEPGEAVLPPEALDAALPLEYMDELAVAARLNAALREAARVALELLLVLGLGERVREGRAVAEVEEEGVGAPLEGLGEGLGRWGVGVVQGDAGSVEEAEGLRAGVSVGKRGVAVPTGTLAVGCCPVGVREGRVEREGGAVGLRVAFTVALEPREALALAEGVGRAGESVGGSV